MSYDDYDDPASDEAAAQYNAVIVPAVNNTNQRYFMAGMTGTGKRRYMEYWWNKTTEAQEMATNYQGKDPYKDGYQMGAALRIITGANLEAQGIGPAIRFLGLKFAEWEGYRETREGMPYLSGFDDGFRGDAANDQALLPPRAG